MTLSIIVPLAAGEENWRAFLPDLQTLPQASDILFVSPDPMPQDFSYRWLVAGGGRAAQMNAGAREAQGDVLWFLHADSRFAENTVRALILSVQNFPDALHYCKLAFLDDGPALMKFNAAGANLRSAFLGVPFGDQGLCISKALFEKIGGFPEGLAYGEDHVFVWQARQCGLDLRCTGAKLFTSARKYRRLGWMRTTLLHQYLWLKQAWPEWCALMSHTAK